MCNKIINNKTEEKNLLKGALVYYHNFLIYIKELDIIDTVLKIHI